MYKSEITFMKSKLITSILIILFLSNCNSTTWSTEEKISAINNCIDSGNPQTYCECSVSILTSLFTYMEFVDFDAQLRSGVQPPSEIISKMRQMGKRVQEECQE